MVRWVYFLALVLAKVFAEDPKEALYARLPESLTLETFDQTLTDGYHLVEFFSPYCHHCSALLPIWVEIFEAKQSPALGIHQVNCVTDGDLCDREAIKYYPVIRFYGPGSKLLGSLNSAKRNFEIIENFINEETITWTDFDKKSATNGGSNVGSAINDKALTQLILGENIKKPTLVSFWPSDSSLNDDTFQSDQNSVQVFKKFPNTYTFRNLWNLVMENLEDKANDLNVGYVNCKDHSNLCKSFGFENLVDSTHSDLIIPKVVMFLPAMEQGGHAIHYNLSMDLLNDQLNIHVKKFSHWVRRLLNNFDLRPSNFQAIKNLLNAKSNLDTAEKVSGVEDYSKIGFILVNDPNSESVEDDYVFKQLLQDVSNLESDVYLFKTHELNDVNGFLQEQENALVEQYINSISKETHPKLEPNREMFISRTHTTYPMILCIKGGSLLSPIYQSFQSDTIRDKSRVLSFIKLHSLPVIDHISTDNSHLHFPPKWDKSIHDKSQLVMIHLVDFQPENFFNAQFYMSWVYHKYQYISMRSHFEKQLEAREKKQAKVDDMKAKDADSVDIVFEMKEPIENSFESIKDQLEVVFLDVKELNLLSREMNWSNLTPSKYSAGDSIIINKYQSSYWDSINGKHLNQDRPFETVELLEKISFDGIWGSSLKNGLFFWLFMFYVSLALGLVLAYRWYRKWSHENHLIKEKRKGLGLLGLDPSEVAKKD